MMLARVTGQVVATIKHACYHGRPLLMLDLLDAAGNATGEYLVAVDKANAAVGQTVLVVDEGSSARQVDGDPRSPLRSIIVAIVDDVQLA